jgi:hypothetical protein
LHVSFKGYTVQQFMHVANTPQYPLTTSHAYVLSTQDQSEAVLLMKSTNSHVHF